MDKLVMQEVSYHLSIGLSSRMHRKKKAPWPNLHLHIRLYKIKSLNYVDVLAKKIMKFEFSTKEFNLYDPHNIYKNLCVKVYYPWIHGTFQWHEKRPWRYFSITPISMIWFV